jgi:hypothetical protein
MLEGFVENLDVIFAEFELEQDGGGSEIFFDTHDVRDAVLGMRAFYVNNTFAAKQFDEPRALVQALAARGDLGPFQMLSAHQAEFLALMSIDFDLHLDSELPEKATTFWQDAGILKKSFSLRTLTDEQLREIVNDQVGQATRFFKAVEAIRGDWRWRLRTWRRDGIMRISSAPEDFAHLVAAKEFAPLKAAFDGRRPQLSENNFADTVALIALIQKVKAFNEAARKKRRDRARARASTFPCFYAPTAQFAKLAKKAGLGHLLEVELPAGRRASVLRDTEYFQLRAIARASRRAADSNSSDVLFTEDVLRKIHDEMRQMLDAQKSLPPDQAANVLQTATMPVRELIGSVRDLSFFDNVWLPFRAADDARAALGTLGNLGEALLKREDVEKDLRLELHALKNEMQTNGDRFRIASALWEELPVRYQQQRKFLLGHTENESRLMRRTGLIRFSFPLQLHAEILGIVAGLLSSSKPVTRTALSKTVSTYLSAFDHPDREAHATIAAAALWIAGKTDGAILNLLRRTGFSPRERHFSLDLVYAAAAVHSGTELTPALNTYNDLERRRTIESGITRGNIAMGLAYLHYHLWNRARNNSAVRDEARRRLDLNQEQIIERAVRLATEAYELVSGDEAAQVKRVYLINQVVYFKTMSGQFTVSEIAPLADKLAQYTEHPEDLWVYRYDDTLARFYLLAADSTTDRTSEGAYLDLAQARSEDARSSAPDDEEVKTTYDQVKKRIARYAEKRVAAQRQGTIAQD